MPNLFGEWTLLREWGCIGQVRMDWFADEAQAVATLIALEAAKRKRGYWVEPQQLAISGLAAVSANT